MIKTLLFVVAAFLPTCLWAVDGVVLINQSTVMAAGGFPYVISQPGSYKLSGNLNMPTPGLDAIQIKSDNVTLDLNGFTISGPGVSVTGAPGTCGINFGSPTHCSAIISSNANTMVKNGALRGFSDALALFGSGSIFAVNASGNLVGISTGGPSSVISRCIANSNLISGISASNATISDSGASNNSGFGFQAFNSTLIHNIATNNSIGMNLTDSLFGSNTLRQNTSDTALHGTSMSQNNNLCSAGVC
jgi:hypothetical protein